MTPLAAANWSGTQRCAPTALHLPQSDDELAALVSAAGARGARLKPVGALHSWSDIAMTAGAHVSLDRMRGLLECDHGAGLVTVRAGTRLRELNALLAERGLAMPILGSVAEQSIAGATATGTHGSSLRHGNVAAAVRGLRLVTGRGEVLDLRGDDPRLAAARVGLGALGVVTRVTLQCVPAFRLREESYPLPFERALADLEQLARGAEFVKLWWLPDTGRVQVFRAERTDARVTVSEAARWVDERVVNRVLFAGVLRLSGWRPGLTATLNRAVARAYFRPTTRVGRSDKVFNIAMPPVHRETEYAVSFEQTREALAATRALIERERLRVNFVAEVRFVRGDDAWLSPAYGRDTCQLGAYMAESADLAGYFRGFQALMRALGGRPHWGKEFPEDARALRGLYPRWDAFRALRRELDPRGVFRNAFTDRVLGTDDDAGG